MRTLALLGLLASCTEVEPPTYEPVPRWSYAPANPAWQLGELRGRFGRGQTPQRAREIGILGDARAPLRSTTVWSVPGEYARAVIDGIEGTARAIELVDVDSGKHVWRAAACVDPVIGVTASTIVCGSNQGVGGVGLDGQSKWKVEHPLVTITGTRVLVQTGREITVLDADSGKQVITTPLATGVARAGIAGGCDDEVYALTSDRLQRFTWSATKAVIVWQTPLTAKAAAPPPVPPRLPRGAPPPPPPMPVPSTIEIVSIDCSPGTILVETRALQGPRVAPAPAPRTLHAIARANGKQTGKVENLRGWWPARDDSAELEVSAAGTVTRWPRDLSAPIAGIPLPLAGELLDARGELRLVRATPLTALVLDRDGVRAYLPLATTRAVLGKDAIVAGTRRIALPAKPDRITRIPPRRAGVALAAELRDLPAVAALPTDRVIAKADLGKQAVGAIALDPREAGAVYAVAVEAATGSSPSAIARADLAAKAWTWQRADGCGPGRPVDLALATGIVACAARGLESTIRATTRDGTAAWETKLDRIDAIDGAGSAILAYDGDLLTVLDAATGMVRGRLASPDGGRVRAAVLAVPIDAASDTTWLVTFEHGRLVARLPAISMIAVWSLEVDGVVASIAPSGDGVLVTLDDGDAYRVELATAMVLPMPGLGLSWRAAGELVTGETIGGPIPGIPAPFLRPPPRLVPVRAPLPGDRNPEAPDLWIPIPPPPPLGDSWQYTLYNRAGGLRIRNDYALAPPITPTPHRGPAGSPLVVVSGAGQVLVIDPKTGDPLRRVTLPVPGFVFGTIVGGEPVAGTVLAAPLRIVLF